MNTLVHRRQAREFAAWEQRAPRVHRTVGLIFQHLPVNFVATWMQSRSNPQKRIARNDTLPRQNSPPTLLIICEMNLFPRMLLGQVIERPSTFAVTGSG